MKHPAVFSVLALLLLSALPAEGQDVEMLGRIHGTRPPAAYEALRARDPGAFRFARAWTARTGLGRRLAPEPGEPGGAQGGGASLLRHDEAPLAVLGRRGAPVSGTFRVPLVLGLFADTPAPPFTREQVARQFFDGPNATGTITGFYREISGGRVELLAQTFEWRRTSLTGADVAGGVSGLGGSSRVGQFIVEILMPLGDAVDWGRFDNDGPDGVPNSGDDDGFVDVLTVMHPTRGAECDQSLDLVWSHRWTLSGALGEGQAFRTGTPSANGGVIRIDDYTIQPVQACSGGAINEIGVVAHELGHAFGLPDLYATGDEQHAGIGSWGLMGTGSWGCRGGEPERPCHMSAWSKAALGWVDVETLPAGADLGTVTLDPVETSGRVLRVEAGDGSGEYFLLENRQRVGYDGSLPAAGLLVWHVDTERLESRWAANAVNADARRMAVWLRQADGRNDLGRPGSSNRGDGGDPFPGTAGATAFHAGTTPASRSHRGTATGLTLLDLAVGGEQVRFRVLTRYQTLRLTGVGEGEAFVVDGDTLPPGDGAVTTAPFQARRVSAPGGVAVREGVRRAFSGWADEPGAGRTRTFSVGLEDAELAARFDGAEEVRLRIETVGDTAGISPGEVRLTPSSDDGWYPPGVEVAAQAVPRDGFEFLGWGGDLDGQPNPALVALGEPVDAAARFQQTFGVAAAATVALDATLQSEISLEASDGTTPYTWSLADGALPAGLDMAADGVIRGAALESGSFPLTVQAVDGLGLVARAPLTLEVSAPVLGIEALTAPFFMKPPVLTSTQEAYLDRSGNADGAYDVGDFRAYVLEQEDLPMTAAERSVVRTLVPLIRFEPPGGGR